MIDIKLNDFLEEHKVKDFIWGELDCVLFACNWCELFVGINPAQGSYGAYEDKKTAYKHLKDEYGDIEQGFDRYFNQISPAFRKKGDIVLCNVEDGQSVGICGARGFVFFKCQGKGLKAIRDPDILNVWCLNDFS